MGNIESTADKRARKYVSAKNKSLEKKRSVDALTNKLNIKSHILVTKTTPITDDYTILSKKKLGQGLHGMVVQCKCKKTGKKYALKKIEDSKNARREIEIQWRASQNFEHIVKLIDVYENKEEDIIDGLKSMFFIVMEYMRGGELFKKIESRKKPFTEFEVAHIMHQIGLIVKHLHSMGIAHRDLKPENLLLANKSNKNFLIKLCDFGFAKEENAGLKTTNFTPYYVAPEILRFEKYDISCDIWSLGVIMYILCCGYPPFYSTHGHRSSPGMFKRIKDGDYTFRTMNGDESPEWEKISEHAKQLIRGMLETEVENRLSIDDIMNSEWMKNYANPDLKMRRLDSIANLKQEENMKQSCDIVSTRLKSLRVNYDVDFKVKNLPDVTNKLLEKRQTKKLCTIKESENTVVDEVAKTSGLTRSSSLPETNPDITGLLYGPDENIDTIVYADHQKNMAKNLFNKSNNL